MFYAGNSALFVCKGISLTRKKKKKAAIIPFKNKHHVGRRINKVRGLYERNETKGCANICICKSLLLRELKMSQPATVSLLPAESRDGCLLWSFHPFKVFLYQHPVCSESFERHFCSVDRCLHFPVRWWVPWGAHLILPTSSLALNSILKEALNKNLLIQYSLNASIMREKFLLV